jgi:hypothetical protein
MRSRMSEYPTLLGNPVDRTAKQVISKGFQYEPAKRFNQEIWDAPPTNVQPLRGRLRGFRGSRQNRMEVVGFIANPPKIGKFLVRCDCGKYELRKISSWKKMRAFDDCCQRCRHIEYLKYSHLPNDQRDVLIARRKRAVKGETNER